MISNPDNAKAEQQLLFAVICLDRLESADIRARTLESHRKFVDEHASMIFSSGPLLDDDGITRAGQLFILKVPDRQHAAMFIEADPFTVAGLFEKVIIRQFAPIFSKGIRQSNGAAVGLRLILYVL